MVLTTATVLSHINYYVVHKQGDAVNDAMVMSYIHPAFFYNGEYFLLILSSIFLIELCRLTVGWAVWIRLIQQTLIVDT